MTHTIARRLALVAGGALAASLLVGAPAAQAAPWHANCTAFNHRHPHGVGRNNAHDHTTGTPVTSFKHSTRLYNLAMRVNSRLDGDHDGIACERA